MGQGLSGHFLPKFFGYESFPMRVDILTQPGEQFTEIPLSELTHQVGNILLGLGKKLC